MRRYAFVLVAVALVGARAYGHDAGKYDSGKLDTGKLDTGKLEFERSLENVNAPGLYHVEIDATLYRHSKKEGLGDLRIVAPNGDEVPWLRRPIPPPQKAQPRAVSIVENRVLPGGGSVAVLDLGAAVPHSQLTIGCDCSLVHVEASDDGARWTRLVDGYAFAGAATLEHPVSSARWLRVRLVGNGARLLTASAAFVPPEAHPLLRVLPSVKPSPHPFEGDGGERQSVWTLDLGAPGVPIAELALDIEDASFVRRAELDAGAGRRIAALLYRLPPQPRAPAEENVRIGAGGARVQKLVLTIENGAEPPLHLGEVSPAFLAEELVFRADEPGVYNVYVGGDVAAPHYDTAALAREQPTLSASWGTVTPNPTFAQLGRPDAAAAAVQTSTTTTTTAPPLRGVPLVVIVLVVAAIVAAVTWLARRQSRK